MSHDLPVPFPVKPAASLEEAVRRYRLVTFREGLPEDEQFEMLLAPGWQRVAPLRPPPDGLRTLLRLVRIEPEAMAHLCVQTTRLIREVAPADWLELMVERQNVRVIDGRHVPTPGGAVADLLGEVETLGQPWIMRATAFKDGDRLFYLRAWCERAIYPDRAEELWAALSSFALRSPRGEPYAEPLLERVAVVGARERAGALHVRFPGSWKPGARPDPSGDPACLAGNRPESGARCWFEPACDGSRPSAPLPMEGPTEVLLRLEDDDGAGPLWVGMRSRVPGEKCARAIADALDRLAGENALTAGPPLHAGTVRPARLGLDGLHWTLPLLGGSELRKLSFVHVTAPIAWIWAAWAQPATSGPEVTAIGRRAFDIVVNHLETMHPSQHRRRAG